MQHTIDTPKYINNKLIPLPHSINTSKYLKKTTKQTVLNQPILSADGTLGGNSFAVATSNSGTYAPYNAFTFSSYSGMVSGGTGLPYWQAPWNTMAEYTMYNPNPIKGTITFYGVCYTTCKIQGSNDGVNFEDATGTLSRGSQVVGFYTFTATITTAYKYLKIVPLTTYNANAGGYILRIKWVDMSQMVEQTEAWTTGTSSNYTLKKPQYHSVNVPKYLKKTTISRAWTQPMNITSNQPLGGNSFAVGAWTRSTGVASTVTSQSWKLFNSTYSGNMNSPQNDDYVNNGTYFIFYNPNPLKISQIGLKEPNVGNAKMKNVELLGSNNGTDWVSIASSTNGATATGGWIFPVNSTLAYKYHKFVCVSASSSSVWIGTKVFNITATEQTEAWTTGTSSNYDLIK